jgi:DNA-directed RNA polymerase specialized sigma24 family protein
MTSETAATGSLCKTFISAMLLTGSAQRAEAAMLDGIAAGHPGDLQAYTLETLLRRNELSDATETVSSLPAELQRVLHLPAELRRCFVLRMLIEWSREHCAAALRIEPREVDRLTSLAAVQLASASPV